MHDEFDVSGLDDNPRFWLFCADPVNIGAPAALLGETLGANPELAAAAMANCDPTILRQFEALQ